MVLRELLVEDIGSREAVDTLVLEQDISHVERSLVELKNVKHYLLSSLIHFHREGKQARNDSIIKNKVRRGELSVIESELSKKACCMEFHGIQGVWSTKFRAFSIEQLLAMTPMVYLKGILKGLLAKIAVELEMTEPYCNVKDRIG